jgi:predicted XRE-type DNA-binding protein
MKKQRVVQGIPVGEGSGNVYTDLGYRDSESMLVKAQLAAKIAEILQRRALTQAHAAEILGLTQPKVSDLLKGRFRGISEHRLLECLTRLGRDVLIVIKPTPKSRSNGLADAFRNIEVAGSTEKHNALGRAGSVTKERPSPPPLFSSRPTVVRGGPPAFVDGASTPPTFSTP